MTKTNFDFVSEVENLAAFLPGVANALSILRDELEMNLNIRQGYAKDMGFFLRISSAMVPALSELDRIRIGLDGIIETAYAQKEESQNDN